MPAEQITLSTVRSFIKWISFPRYFRRSECSAEKADPRPRGQCALCGIVSARDRRFAGAGWLQDPLSSACQRTALSSSEAAWAESFSQTYFYLKS